MRRENPVAFYCERYRISGETPHGFARAMLVRDRELCLRVMEEIGSFPSSETELSALQKEFR